ncbi:MAG TPA: hypothetical protein VLT47_02715 [Anaeromyxobacteraceae bacterium]|nr:hypothetical protein [Anaeromyxobacteraceae bacterium]
MAQRPRNVRHGALHALVLLAFAACGSTDPPGEVGAPVEAGGELRLPKTFSAVIEPTGPHAVLPTEGFGLAVAVSGARVAVADFHDWEYAGLAFPHVDTFELVGGVAVPAGKLPATGFAEHPCFGEAIALDGELLAIGEPCAAGGDGVVHSYAWDGRAWVEEPPLAPPAGAVGARFGATLAMAANRMVVGAPFAPAVVPGGAETWGVGAAYVFSRSGGGWQPDTRLAPSDGLFGDTFGAALGMEASRIAVASPGRWNGDAAWNPLGPNGKVYVFELQGGSAWSEAAALVFAGGRPGEWIGRTLTLCSGAIFAGGDLQQWPAVHALRLGPGGWTEGDLDDPSLPGSCWVDDPSQPNNCRVDQLACDGSLLVVGMPFANGWIGTARTYEKLGGAWRPKGEIAGAAAGDRAGHAVAVDGSVIAVGIPSAVVDGRAVGIVRVQRF